MSVLGDTQEPINGDILMDLGKSPEYERHVEAIRIAPIESFREKGALLAWCTRTSAVAYIELSEITVIGRHYKLPVKVEDIQQCLGEYTDTQFNFPVEHSALPSS